jgi:hypothetical protein
MEDELWKEIEGYPDYMISNRGNLLSKRTMTTKLVKGSIVQSKRSSYPQRQFTLRSPTNQKRGVFASVLVAKAFLDHDERVDTVRHINGNTLDDSAENLVSVPNGSNNISQLIHEIKLISRSTQTPMSDLLDMTVKWLRRRLQQNEEPVDGAGEEDRLRAAAREWIAYYDKHGAREFNRRFGTKEVHGDEFVKFLREFLAGEASRVSDVRN